MICSVAETARMNTLLKPSETDDTDAIAAAYLYAAKGDPNAALTQLSQMPSSQLRSYAAASSKWSRRASHAGNS